MKTLLHLKGVIEMYKFVPLEKIIGFLIAFNCIKLHCTEKNLRKDWVIQQSLLRESNIYN